MVESVPRWSGVIQKSIDQLSESLMVVLASAQFLQRQSRQDTSLSAPLVEEQAEGIASAAMAMLHELEQLEGAREE